MRIKFTLDSILETNLPTNLLNSTSLNFGLTELFAGASAISENNFDDLMIPFRCVASDIVEKKPYIFEDGDLGTAIRASISFPFLISPLKHEGKLLYDGGLYDNFPVSTLCESFNPDYIIGCNVSYNYPDPDEDNLLSQFRSMMSKDTDYKINCKGGIVIEPPVSDLGVLEFKKVPEVIQEGYNSTLQKIDSIKAIYPFHVHAEEIQEKRDLFKKNTPTPKLIDVEVYGLNKSESNYILNSIRFKPKDSLKINVLRSRIMKLVSDERIKELRPELYYDHDKKGYILKLFIKREKKMFVSFGGNISTKSVNEGFVGLQYNHMNIIPITLYGNTYFGKFYSSGKGQFKANIPFRIPLELSASYIIGKWDYFQNSTILFEESAPSYMIHKDNYSRFGLGLPVFYKGKIELGLKTGLVEYEYYQDNEFTRFDTADITSFENTTLFAQYQSNSLNRKQYANQGSNYLLKASYVNGTEFTHTGSAAPVDTIVKTDRQWFILRAKIDQYFFPKRKFKFGFQLEGVYSDQPFFSNYASSILAAPSFEPTPESKTVFRSSYRAHKFGAVGLKTIFTPIKNLDFRLEGYLFQPFNQIESDRNHHAVYNNTREPRYFIGSFTTVYSLRFTQIALNINYYDNFNENFPTNDNGKLHHHVTCGIHPFQ